MGPHGWIAQGQPHMSQEEAQEDEPPLPLPAEQPPPALNVSDSVQKFYFDIIFATTHIRVIKLVNTGDCFDDDETT